MQLLFIQNIIEVKVQRDLPDTSTKHTEAFKRDI